MFKFFLRKLGTSVITLLLLVFIVFMLTRVFPSDPARQIAGPFAPQERVDELNELYGFNDPLLVQLGRQYVDVITLNFGEAFTFPGEQVRSLVGTALWASAKLVIFSLIITIPLSVLGGVLAARKRDTFVDRTIVTVGLASASIPEFVSGLLIQYLIGVKLGWFKSIANVPEGTGFFASFEYLILPALAIFAVYFGYIARVARAGTITAFESDYSRTAFMKGLSTPKVIRRHILRNGLQPTVAVVGTQIGYLFGGLVGLELVYNYPGLGRLIFNAATKQDIPLLTAGVLTVAVIFMFTTLAADLLIAWMNPRARQEVSH